MPTKEQMETASEHIKDVIGRNYIEGDGDQCSCWFQPEGGGAVGMTIFQGVPAGTPEPFAEMPSKAKAELLATCVGWDGFTDGERADVINRVLDGEDMEFWMDGIKNYNPENDFSRPLTGKQHENYLSDIAASFGMTSEEVDDYYYRMESHPHQAQGGSADRPVRPLTEELIAAAMLDVWPGIATVVDFGIDSERHLGALQFAIREELVTPQELDAAMGSGAKLTEIAQRGENPYRDVTFKTSWDGLPLEPPNEAGEHDTKALFAEWTADYAAAKERDSGKAEFNRILTEQPQRQEPRRREPEERER